MRPISSAADLAACRRVLRRESRTFHAASLLLPARVRGPASALYAFCRLADDAVDCPGERSAVERLDRLRVRLERIYAGRPLPMPVDRALADAVERFGIPKRILDALFEGFEWDIEGRRPADLGELHAYAARVAGTVGAMMAVLMGQRSADVVARACDLGVAMQLSNIARDVGEDAFAGRLYLPWDWLREAGIDPDAWLKEPVFSEALGSVVLRLVDAADVLYRRADDGIAKLPADCRPGISAARHLYAGIGHQVAARGGDSIASRAVVPASRKARLLGRALVAAAVNRDSRAGHAPLEATRFLVEAVASAGAAETPPQASDQVIWLIMLFERLERGQRAALERHG
jgi:15-cis-phytoene synthase